MKKGAINKACLFYLMVACVTGFPLTCGYIMDGGIIREWIARMDELSAALGGGRLLLFPTEQAILSGGGQLSAMNSNLWFFLPALIAGKAGGIVYGWECYMIFMQIATLLSSALMFKRLFEDENSDYPIFFGVLLYMSCPYRIYVCYDLADMAQVAVWALLPLYVWAVLGIIRRKQTVVSLLTAALVLAGMGYADLMQMLVIAGFTLLAALGVKRFLLLPALGAGCVAALPCLLRLFSYLFRGAYAVLDIPIYSIMDKGYAFGEFFSIFVYREGHPGMGLGMLLCLLVGLWLSFVQGQYRSKKECVFFAVSAAALLFMSLRHFPWEYAQRLGSWSLKLVALFGTPAIFFGLAQACLCVLGAWSAGQLKGQEDKVASVGMPVLVTAACLGLCIYQCNMLTYTRMPL